MKWLVHIALLGTLSSCSTKSINSNINTMQWDYLQGNYRSSCSGPRCEYRNTEIDIAKIENDKFKVTFWSTQAKDSVCSFELEMNLSNEYLQYKFPNGGEMTIKLINNKLIVNSSPLTPTDGDYRFCGNHAYIDNIAIPVSSKKDQIELPQ